MLKRITAFVLTAVMSLSVIGFTTVYAEKDSDKMATSKIIYTGDYRKNKSEGADLRIMTYNVLADDIDYEWGYKLKGRTDGVIACIDYYKPDIIGMQENTTGWYAAIREALGDTYEYVNDSLNGQHLVTTFMYNKNTLTLENQDCVYYTIKNNQEARVISMGCFTRKADGKKFVFISTHLDSEYPGDRSKERLLQIDELIAKAKSYYSKNRCEVIAVGDMNYYINTDEYVKMTTDGFFHDLDANPPAGVVDHMFGSSGVETVYNARLNDNEIKDCSDHLPLLADIKLPASSAAYTLGDVNKDGVIDVEDALATLRGILGITKLNATKKKAADVNLDGKLNISDVVKTLRVAVKLDTLPV